MHDEIGATEKSTVFRGVSSESDSFINFKGLLSYRSTASSSLHLDIHKKTLMLVWIILGCSCNRISGFPYRQTPHECILSMTQWMTAFILTAPSSSSYTEFWRLPSYMSYIQREREPRELVYSYVGFLLDIQAALKIYTYMIKFIKKVSSMFQKIIHWFIEDDRWYNFISFTSY